MDKNNLSQAIAQFEDEFARVEAAGAGPLSETGEEFRECLLSGYPTYNEAVAAWEAEARKMFPMTPFSVLRWKITPEIKYVPESAEESSQKKGWAVYSRFSVSNKTN